MGILHSAAGELSFVVLNGGMIMKRSLAAGGEPRPIDIYEMKATLALLSGEPD